MDKQGTVYSSVFKWIDTDSGIKILHFTPNSHIRKIYIGIPVEAIRHPNKKTYRTYEGCSIPITTKENGGCGVTSIIDGIATILPPVCIDNSFMAIVDNECDILSINTSQSEINKYVYTIEEIEKRHNLNKAKERIKINKRKRELEKQALQELIDEGEIFPEANKRPPIPRDVVDTVWNRDGGRCVYCGSTENLHLDHIIPFSKGGDTSVENLQLLCQKCNLEKSNKIG